MNFLADAQACEPQPRQRVDLVRRRVANQRAVYFVRVIVQPTGVQRCPNSWLLT